MTLRLVYECRVLTLKPVNNEHSSMVSVSLAASNVALRISSSRVMIDWLKSLFIRLSFFVDAIFDN